MLHIEMYKLVTGVNPVIHLSEEDIMSTGLSYSGLSDIVDIFQENGLDVSETDVVEFAEYFVDFNNQDPMAHSRLENTAHHV